MDFRVSNLLLSYDPLVRLKGVEPSRLSASVSKTDVSTIPPQTQGVGQR